MLVWTLLALSPNTIQTLLVAFKVAPYPTSLSVLISYQLWLSLRLMTQLDQVSCDQSTGMKALVQTRHSPKTLKGCGEDRGMLQWQRYLWQGRLRLLAWKDKQSISRRGGRGCNIDAVFIIVMIAKYYSVFICLVGYVWNCRGLKYFRLLLKNRKIAIASSVQHK